MSGVTFHFVGYEKSETLPLSVQILNDYCIRKKFEFFILAIKTLWNIYCPSFILAHLTKSCQRAQHFLKPGFNFSILLKNLNCILEQPLFILVHYNVFQ